MPTFSTSARPHLRFDVASGSVEIDARSTAATSATVELLPDGNDGDALELIAASTIEQCGDEIVVKVPTDWVGRNPRLRLAAELPAGSTITGKSKTSDMSVSGNVGGAELASGAGDVAVDAVAGDLRVTCGSGDVSVRHVAGSAKIKTGSGDVRVGDVGGLDVVAGSGDITVDVCRGDLALKSGSGDIRVGVIDGPGTGSDAALVSGSGDLRIARVADGTVSMRTASGDIGVGVASGTAAWLDLNTVTGRVDSRLEDAGPPQPGEPVVELSATSVTGRIVIERA